MTLAEPQAWLDDRKARLGTTYPELSVAGTDSLLNVDGERLRTGEMPSTFTQAALALATPYDESTPDTALNVTPWAAAPPPPAPAYSPETPDTTANVMPWVTTAPTGTAPQSWLVRANMAIANSEQEMMAGLQEAAALRAGTMTLQAPTTPAPTGFDRIAEQTPDALREWLRRWNPEYAAASLTPEERAAVEARRADPRLVTPEEIQEGISLVSGVAGGLKVGPFGRGPKPPTQIATALEEPSNAVSALLKKIGEAKPLEAQNQELLSQFRSRQAGAFSGSIQGGEEGFNKGMAAMRGQSGRVGFEPLRNAVGQQGVDELFNRLRGARLRPFEHANAGSALRSIMDGVVPVPSELAQLEKAFPGVTKALEDAGIVKGPGLGAYVNDLIQVPQSLKSAFDLSGFRQTGTSAVAHPKMGADAFAKSLKALVSEDNMKAIDQDLAGRWYAGLRDDAGVVLADGEIGLSKSERTAIARFVNRIPGYRPTQRAYATMLNVMRDSLFQYMLKESGGNPNAIPDDQLRQIGRLVNIATGRGDLKDLKVLGQSVGGSTVTDNKVFGTPIFWAPRLFLSRVQLPFEVLSSNPTVRKEAARQLVSFVGVNSTLVGVGAAMGLWDVETDPRSADFMQIRVGNQRIDPWAGFRPIANLVARLWTGEVKSTTSGETYDKERGQIILDFLRQKFSPATSIAASSLTGENAIGEDYTKTEFAKDLVWPLFFDNIVEAIRIEGLSGLPGAALGGLGAGVNTYEGSSSSNSRGPARAPRPPRAPRAPRPGGGR